MLKGVYSMNVIKRNGQTQAFNLEKIKTSLICTSSDIKQPLTESDLNNILAQIESLIYKMDTNQITYVQIHMTVLEVLSQLGFKNIANAYDEFENSFVNK